MKRAVEKCSSQFYFLLSNRPEALGTRDEEEEEGDDEIVSGPISNEDKRERRRRTREEFKSSRENV